VNDDELFDLLESAIISPMKRVVIRPWYIPPFIPDTDDFETHPFLQQLIDEGFFDEKPPETIH